MVAPNLSVDESKVRISLDSTDILGDDMKLHSACEVCLLLYGRLAGTNICTCFKHFTQTRPSCLVAPFSRHSLVCHVPIK